MSVKMFFIKNYRILNQFSKLRFNKRFRHSVSYTYSPSNESLSPMTIGQLIEERAHDSENKIAIISQHQNISKSYQELNFDTNKLSKGLRSIGCGKGSRVGIWAPNCYEWIVAQYATAKIGAILVNVNPGYQALELEYCLNLVGCHTLISSQKFKSTDYCQILESLEPNILKEAKGHRVKSHRIPTLENVLMIDSTDGEESAPKNLIRLNEFLSQFAGNSNVDTSFNFDEPINIQFTSGTTGNPKGATLTHFNIIQNAYLCGKRSLEGLEHNILCVPPPLYHCFGSVVGSLMCALNKGTLVLPAPVYDPIDTLKAIQNYRCDVVYGTPTMFIDLLNSHPSQFDTTSLKRGFMTGAPCPKPLIQEVLKTFPTMENILIPYGTTECSPTITFTSIHDSEKHQLESVGRPIDLLEVKIVDVKSDEITPIGESGEVCVRGHNLFVGYWNQEDKTRECVDKTKWYHTGDIGVMDKEGYISINGRIKEMIIRGGENIYPREIEEFLIKHEDISDIQIVGIPDERFGEELVAFIILKSGSYLNKEDIKTYCKGKISHFKIPKYIEFVDEFPRTVTGKVEKYKLKKIALELYDEQSTNN